MFTDQGMKGMRNGLQYVPESPRLSTASENPPEKPVTPLHGTACADAEVSA